jgi:hypothetical protein
MNSIEIAVLVAHFIVSTLFLIFIFSGKSYIRKEFISLIVLIPFFGVLGALVIEILNRKEKQGKKPIGLASLTSGEDILWKSLKKFQEKGDIVPLEEAMTINNVKIRRRMMLDVIHDDPMKFLDAVMLARHNKDIETSHYATTTVSHLQRTYQIQIQNLAVEVENNPDDVKLLDSYISKLEDYMESGLLEQYLLKNQRIMLFRLR